MLEDSGVPDDLIDRYLRRQLSADERAEFEIRMLEDPRVFDAVRESELMYQAFNLTGHETGSDQSAQARQEQSAISYPTNNKVSNLPFRLWIKHPMSLAATVMLGVGVLMIANLTIQQPGTDGNRSGYGVNSVVNIGQVRGTDSEIMLPRGVHLLQVDVGISMSDAPYLVRLSSEDNNKGHDFQVVPDGNGVIRILTPADLQGRYQLAVRQQDTTENSARYGLRFD